MAPIFPFPKDEVLNHAYAPGYSKQPQKVSSPSIQLCYNCRHPEVGYASIRVKGCILMILVVPKYVDLESLQLKASNLFAIARQSPHRFDAPLGLVAWVRVRMILTVCDALSRQQNTDGRVCSLFHGEKWSWKDQANQLGLGSLLMPTFQVFSECRTGTVPTSETRVLEHPLDF